MNCCLSSRAYNDDEEEEDSDRAEYSHHLYSQNFVWPYLIIQTMTPMLFKRKVTIKIQWGANNMFSSPVYMEFFAQCLAPIKHSTNIKKWLKNE